MYGPEKESPLRYLFNIVYHIQNLLSTFPFNVPATNVHAHAFLLCMFYITVPESVINKVVLLYIRYTDIQWYVSVFKFCVVSFDVRSTSIATCNWSSCTLCGMWPNAPNVHRLFMLNKPPNRLRSGVYWALLWVHVSAGKPCATKDKENSFICCFLIWLKKKKWYHIHPIHTHTHTHTQTYKDATYPPETHRPLGSLPFTQKPLGKVMQSNTNTFSLVSEEALRFEKTAKSESPKVNHSRWGVTEHEVRTTNMPNRCSPQGCVFTICEISVCAFQQGWISKLFTFFFLPPRMSPLTEKPFFKFVFLIPSALCLCLQLKTRRGGGNEENERYLN